MADSNKNGYCWSGTINIDMRAREFITERAKKPAALHPNIASLTFKDVPQPFVTAFKERGITNPNTILAYYKISGKETGALGGPENMDYSGTSNKNIIKLFGEPNSRRGTKQSNTNNVNYMAPDKLNWLKADPERFAKFIYSGQKARIVPDAKQGYRMEFGTPELAQRAQDAWQYRGRGHVQITGRDQYAQVSQELFGDDRLLKNPDLLNDPALGLRASAAYAKKYGKADQDQSPDVQQSLNRALTAVGGSNIYAPGGRMYSQQIKRLNQFGQQLAQPQTRARHDQHYAGIDLTKPLTATAPAVSAKEQPPEPGVLDRVAQGVKSIGSSIGNMFQSTSPAK
jgi:predicted chitinase